MEKVTTPQAVRKRRKQTAFLLVLCVILVVLGVSALFSLSGQRLRQGTEPGGLLLRGAGGRKGLFPAAEGLVLHLPPAAALYDRRPGVPGDLGRPEQGDPV